MRVFVTGGAGYIGSHTVLQLLLDGHEVCVYDNLSNSSPIALERVGLLANALPELQVGDIRDASTLSRQLIAFRPDAVIHFAGLKAVGESTRDPLNYYNQNVWGSLVLLKAMEEAGCTRIIFSSSATVYGEAVYLPFDEQHPFAPTNPYGRTKAFIEAIIQDWALATTNSSAVILRYFNPVGADASGLIGEDPNGMPNNLLPYIAQVAVGRLSALRVFGNDFDTRDGTGERDYIHVEDLARAHIAALAYSMQNSGCEAVNVGSGQGVTVLEMLRAFEAACGKPIPHQVVARREGDVAKSIAAVEKSHALLKWKTRFTLEDICSSAWNWQSRNPNGYGKG